jgi:hypothetical protein
VGDTREPDRSLGWGETDRRNGSARDVRGADLVRETVTDEGETA